MKLEIGDQVKVIDEALEGRVTKIQGNQFWVNCQDGFDYPFAMQQLIKIGDAGRIEYQGKSFSMEEDKPSDIIPSRGVNINLKGKKPLVDLHMEYLFPDHSFRSNHEVLSFQLSCVREVIYKAKRARYRNLILIHGVGRGILRSAIHDLLNAQYPEIEYLDASYQLHGQGATEIIIHGLGKAE